MTTSNNNLYNFVQDGHHHSDNLHILQTSWIHTYVEFTTEFCVLNLLGKHFQQQNPNKIIYVISSNSPHTRYLEKYFEFINVDIIIYCTLADPGNPHHVATLKNIQNIKKCELKIIGHDTIDFWAIPCAMCFKPYVEEELEPKTFKYLFLNYNNKPKPSRIKLVNELENSGLVNYGLITLADNPKYLLDPYGTSEILHDDIYMKFIANSLQQIDANGAVAHWPIRGFQLGQMEIWNSSFINLVSESQIKLEVGNVFITEKTFKPIIGMRPFLIYGNPGIYNLLKSQGFDCFEDLFPVNQLSVATNEDEILKLVINSLNQFVGKDIDKLYQELKPRLIANRQHFFKYTKNQINWLNNLSEEKNILNLYFLNTLKQNLFFQKFDQKIKMPNWPNDITSFDQLPDQLQQELIDIHNFKNN